MNTCSTFLFSRLSALARTPRLANTRVGLKCILYMGTMFAGVFGSEPKMFLERKSAGGGAGAGVPGVRGSRSAAGSRQPLRPGGDKVCVGAQRPQGSRELQHHFCR